MNILMVSSFLPYPLFSGGHVRLYNILKKLSKNHKITLVCEKRSYQTEEDIKEVEKLCDKVFTVERKKQWSVNNILKSGYSSYPFLMVGHTNSSMKEILKDLLSKNNYDLIHVETFYVMQNLSATKTPVVLVEHNIEYLVYKRFVENSPFWIRPFLLLDILKMKSWEKTFWKKATKLVAVSEDEKRLMERLDVDIVPNGVDVAKFKVQNSKFKIDDGEKRVLFIGDFKWMQNRDAASFILKEIWPRFIKNQTLKSKVKLWIVGREIPDSIKKLTNDENVIFDEDASKDTFDIYKKADLLLAPIRIGGGTSFKILEAMASGVPVITTKLGIEGIKAKDKKEVLLAENPEEFLNKITKILIDKDLYKTIKDNARELIEKEYNWDKIVSKLEEVYKAAVS